MVIESTDAERVYYRQVNRVVELVCTKYRKVLISYEKILREINIKHTLSSIRKEKILCNRMLKKLVRQKGKA